MSNEGTEGTKEEGNKIKNSINFFGVIDVWMGHTTRTRHTYGTHQDAIKYTMIVF